MHICIICFQEIKVKSAFTRVYLPEDREIYSFFIFGMVFAIKIMRLSIEWGEELNDACV
jgi:hypothetical protein